MEPPLMQYPTPPTLTVSQVEALWSAMQALAPEHVEQPLGDGATEEELVEAVESGASLHDALTRLAWRGWSVEALERLADRSAARAEDPKRWQKERSDIARYVETAVSKRADQAKKAFGAPAILPVGAQAPADPPPYNPDKLQPGKSDITGAKNPLAGDIEQHSSQIPAGERDEARRQAQLEEARAIGEGDPDDYDLRPTIMSLEDMIRDLVYVEGSGAVVHLPTMRVRKKEYAANAFKASKERWVDQNGNMQERAAFPLWMESPGRMSVDVITWTPRFGPVCRPPEAGEAGDRAVNLWRGFNAWPEPEDDLEPLLEPFHEHLAYLVPIEAERERFVKWLAHIVQRPGELPHTCYLMITETTGIGRNWLTCLLASVFRGYVAAGVDLSGILDGKFNGRLSRKVLATVDEAQEGLSGQRFQKANTLKRIITEEWREINPKYGVPSVEYNCCRWLMLSNHRDALPIDNKDRRVVVIDNPTVRQDRAYYDRIYKVVRRPEFVAAVYHYLLRVDLAGFVAQEPAPMNAAKRSALSFMESDLETALREFKDEWPGDFVDYYTLKNYVIERLDGQEPNRFHLKRTMNDVGMKTTKRRLMVKGQRSYIVLLNLPVEAEFEAMGGEAVVEAINDARARLTFGDGEAK